MDKLLIPQVIYSKLLRLVPTVRQEKIEKANIHFFLASVSSSDLRGQSVMIYDFRPHPHRPRDELEPAPASSWEFIVLMSSQCQLHDGNIYTMEIG